MHLIMSNTNGEYPLWAQQIDPFKMWTWPFVRHASVIVLNWYSCGGTLYILRREQQNVSTRTPIGVSNREKLQNVQETRNEQMFAGALIRREPCFCENETRTAVYAARVCREETAIHGVISRERTSITRGSCSTSKYFQRHFVRWENRIVWSIRDCL